MKYSQAPIPLFLMACFFLTFSPNGLSKESPRKELSLNLEFTEELDLNQEFNSYNSNLFFTPINTLEQEFTAPLNPNSELSFEKFLKLVQENHPQIIQAQIKRNLAQAKHLETKGAFDPALNSKNGYNIYNSSSALGKEQEAFTSNNSLDILSRYGAKLSLGAKFAEGDIKAPLSPTGSGGEYFLEAQIPLLRDAIYNSKNIKEKSAALNEAIADLNLYQKKIEILQKATEAYWKWYASFQILEVEQHLIHLIQEQNNFIASQIELGNLAPLTLIEIDTELQRRLLKKASAERKYQEASLTLANYLWLNSAKPLGLIKQEQIPQINELIKSELGLEEINNAKLNALQLRPEFKAIGLSKDIAILERKFAKNQILPALDLFMNQGIETGDNSIGPTTSAGLNLSIPLRVRTAQGLKKQAELNIQSLNLASRELLQNVILQIENTSSELEISKQKVKFAKQNLISANQLFEGESEKFKLGDSTLFLLIRRQRNMAEANIEYHKAFSKYKIAEQNFELVQGKLNLES